MIVGESTGFCIKCHQAIKDGEFVTWSHGGEEHVPSCPDPMEDRVLQITRCMSEIEKCVEDQATNKGLGFGILGEMDWRSELHTRIHNA